MATPAELVAAARAGALPELTTGHSNQVFDGGDLVVKVFKSQARAEPEREWMALSLLHGLQPGLVPEPVHIDLDELACVVTRRVDGAALTVATVTDDARAVAALGEAFACLAAVVPSPRRSLPLAIIHPWLLGWRMAVPSAPWHGEDRGDPDVRAALAQAQAWLRSNEATAASVPGRQLLGRGDPKLANHLWDGERIVLLDFEDTGWCDPVHDVAQLAEHQASWGMPDRVWQTVAEALDVVPTGADLLAARRLVSCFWLSVLVMHDPCWADGRVATQAQRTLALLG